MIQSLYWNKQNVVVQYQSSAVRMERVEMSFGGILLTSEYLIYTSFFSEQASCVTCMYLPFVSRRVNKMPTRRCMLYEEKLCQKSMFRHS